MPTGVPRSQPRCSVDGCETVARARGWCTKHYKRWATHGDPLTVAWRVNSDSYRAVHAWVRRHHPKTGRCEHCGLQAPTDWATKVKPCTRNRDDWLELCRRCHRQFDGNPHAAYQREKTHCAHGHPYDETNTYRDSDGKRHCRVCRAATARRFRERRALGG